MVEKRVLVFAVVLLFCMPFVFAINPGLISDCTVANALVGCDGGNNFTAVGRVSNDGHYGSLSNVNFPNYLCCRNFDSIGSGAVSFKYAGGVNGSGHVSVNSTFTYFPTEVKLGFPNSCYLKQGTCDHASSEVCIFKVSGDPLPYADSAHISDCNNNGNPPGDQPNAFPNNLCCKFSEICTDGKDNDFDTYKDCADLDCNHADTAGAIPPEFCTGSPYTSDKCVNVTRYPNGTNVTTYNPACKGPDPYGYFYCSYGRVSAPGTPGLCCPAGKYAFKGANGVWTCQVAEKCGLGNPFSCYYDFDLQNAPWRNSVYTGGSLWCVSRMPNLYSPDSDPFSPRRSNGCCLIQQSGSVDYYTDPGNVKIFGYQHVCGDWVLDPGEQCDGPITNLTCSNFINCTGFYVPTGNVTCTGNCQINHAGCHCAPQGGGT
jgi:hypothetical protein